MDLGATQDFVVDKRRGDFIGRHGYLRSEINNGN